MNDILDQRAGWQKWLANWVLTFVWSGSTMIFRAVVCSMAFHATLVGATDNTSQTTLDLSIPKDILNYKPTGRILALHVNSHRLSAEMKAYAARVMEKIDLAFDESRILDGNGKQVCANAQIVYRMVIRRTGALEQFDIAFGGSTSLSSQDSLLRDALSEAAYRAAPYETFSPEHFLGFELVGIEATHNLLCKRQRFIRVKPSSGSN